MTAVGLLMLTKYEGMKTSDKIARGIATRKKNPMNNPKNASLNILVH